MFLLTPMTKADNQFITQLNSIIDKRIHESNLSSETLAADFCICPRHFNRKVNAITGMNSTLYIRKRRIEKACVLLRTTTLPISAIYVKCGIESANYFSRIFKTEIGITPTDYRRNNQE